jgi:ABC-2 type transport system permease protein
MRTILYIIQKEFIQVSRNKTMLPIIFAIPVIQLVILVYAATFEMKNINVCFVDRDLSTISRQMQSKFAGSPFYRVIGNTFSIKEAEHLLKKDEVDVIIHIPDDFEKDLIRNNKANVQLIVNAINGTKASLANAYSQSIIAQYNKEVIAEMVTSPSTSKPKNINITSSFWFNNDLNYKIYMLPGILVVLVTVIGTFLAGMNIVREKEIGTIEQINVTPIKKYQFIIGKLIPFWLIALFEFAFGLVVGKILFDLPIEGNLFVLFSIVSLYLLVALGIGLFMSTITDTQQQVMFIAWFFMLVFILMSGIFTPAESMPKWAQQFNLINPIAYLMKANRMILLKGSGFAELKTEFISLTVYAIAILSLSVWRYKKVR